jgi:hypothetical protein
MITPVSCVDFNLRLEITCCPMPFCHIMLALFMPYMVSAGQKPAGFLGDYFEPQDSNC